MSGPDDDPLDVGAVREDDELVEDLRAGVEPPDGDQVAEMLAAWRDETQR